MPLSEVECLLQSHIHEERLAALVILGLQAGKANAKTRRQIYDLYLANTEFVNNWDLVDLSAPHLVGAYLEGRSHRPLYRLAKSKSLWERRISILTTFHFIRQNDFADTLKIAEILLADEEDLMHKAVGWMLRYAIEKFPERKRQAYLKRRSRKVSK